ncbi:MAG TPA: PhoX family phosphatase, partial [Polyangia bacterium]
FFAETTANRADPAMPNTKSQAPAPGTLFTDVVSERLSRRGFLQGAAASSVVAFIPGCATDDKQTVAPGPLLGFKEIPISKADDVVVPDDYTWTVVTAWGDPIVAGGPSWRSDASQSADDQAKQAGMNHDGMAYFPLPKGSNSSDNALIAINFEAADDGLLSPDGMTTWTAEKVKKSKNAHGLGVIEVKFDGKRWNTVTNSRYGRRLTADTPFELRGPAAGHAWMKTAADPEGRKALGTFSNCAGGRTPWGTYLSCEENVTQYFVNDSGMIPRLQDRYGVPTLMGSGGFRWHEFDERFDAVKHPNEPNRHGWVVELDPYDPDFVPIKRTAMGRLAHEGATLALASDGRVVFYMGDDDFRSRFEHVYKFVSKRPHVKGGSVRDNLDILDEGTLYAAKFNEDGSGEWLPLVQGQGPLTAENGFASQAEVLIDTRTAADRVGATYMDRPEWVAVHPSSGEVYCALSNNSARGTGKPIGAKDPLGPDAANPRAPNPMGHIIRWREDGNDAAATRFQWDLFLQAGDPDHDDEKKRGDVKSKVAFGAPDGLYFDARGVLWIQTDSSMANMMSADWGRIGNNQMLAADPVTGEVRRFLTGPVGCEITGMQMTPDQRTFFVNIQHPGETPMPPTGRNDPNAPQKYSSWPDGPGGGRPRSATIAIRRKDGGVIGT